MFLIKEAVRIGAEPERKRLHFATKIPFTRLLFFKIFPKMIGSMFNGNAFFEAKGIESDKKHYRVDVLKCPYMKYLELLGFKELTSTFCFSDDRVYGNMCGIAYERQGTIGRGSDKCDFYFYRNDQKK
ncbi:MAG: L-2-amino-thiazoline-4-carboxylic acid hydrolase [Candidatus Caccosoma sp.]|nr:L-2-amino-thiazoline-4-carboxylic acid hydrolase [Candidatus Caccosoma sp.]